MPCTRPRTVGFLSDGKTICWSEKNNSKEYATFQLPCGKCIDCRLAYARQWAIRCVHEAQMHPDNCFITLTYSDLNLSSPRLVYEDWQKFMKRLRFANPNCTIGAFVTGEYGEKTKRPHWHAILFGYAPQDQVYRRSNERGDKIYESSSLTELWSHGFVEIGSVSIESAGYCARYAAKKLVHGKDDEHDYKPISKKSSKYAIGKKWIEQFYPDVFNYGRLILQDGTEAPIPRYYEKWFKENHPEEWRDYVTNVKSAKLYAANQRSQKEINEYWATVYSRSVRAEKPMTPNQVKNYIKQKQFKQLQAYLKL